MPSSPQQPPTVTAKPRGIFLRKRISELVNSGPSKNGSKNSTSINKSQNNNSARNEPAERSCQNTIPSTERNVHIAGVATNNDDNVDNVGGTVDTNNNMNNDGNNNTFSFNPTISQSERQMSNEENRFIASDHNSSFSSESRTVNESSRSKTSAEASAFTTTSSTSHRQRIQRQITRTSETKTSSVTSDRSELSSLSEIKNLHFTNAEIRKSLENMLDTNNVVAVETSTSAEPLITYPESPTPSATNPNITSFPSDFSGSRKNSNASTIEDLHSCNFERRLSSASKTKLFIDGERLANEYFESSAVQSNNMLKEKSLDTRHERILSSEDITRQQSQNVSSSTVKVQTDSFNSAEKLQNQVLKSSGTFNQVFSKNVSTSFSRLNNNSPNFIKNEINDTMVLVKQSSLSHHLSESFDDLNKLRVNASQQDVDKAISKYSERLRGIIDTLTDKKLKVDESAALDKLSDMMSNAWLVPTHGHELGNSLCDVLRECGGLKLLISNCDSNDESVKFSSVRLLEQCLTTDNRAYVVNNGLEKVVCVAYSYSKNSVSVEHSRVSTGILEHLFKHSENTCENVVRLGGLDAVLLECRKNDLETLRHCACALANLSLYGGAENQEAMIKRKTPIWLFPLAFHNDDNIKYYACLAIAVLVANKEIEAEVLKSGTLNLVEPFITSRNPSEFARSNLSHVHGQSQNWLQRLVPVLSSKREEARSLAAFHFCMEAGIKKSQGNTKVFTDIGAIECLKKVASCPNAIASKFAAQALRLIGETVPHKLIQQVPLWSVEDVKQWVLQIGFVDYSDNFEDSRVDGDLLLQLTEENLRDDIGIRNGIRRIRFTRELQILKKMADYSSRDADNLNDFLQSIGPEFSVYTYSMLNAGVHKDYLKSLSQDQLLNECGIVNSIHRLRILEAIKNNSNYVSSSQQELEKPLDVFISYRRSNGSQLASLLKVHLQVRNFSVFIDVEKLEAGKFDNNLLQSIKHACNFILVLTPSALDRCIGDTERKDWVHREIVAALQSNCNIIPITDNFQWPEPEALPEDMRAICHFNGIKWIHDYQDACVDKLERFIRGEVSSKNLGQDLPTTVPHGGKLLKNDGIKGIMYQRTLSNDSNKETDSGIKD